MRGEAGAESFPSNFAKAIARWDWLEERARLRPIDPALGGGSGMEAMGLRPPPEVEAEERLRLYARGGTVSMYSWPLL